MIRFNIIPTLICSAIILAAIGCGDPSSLDTTDGDTDHFGSDHTSAPAASELELACEAFCDTAGECRVVLATEDCVERCEARFALVEEDDDECAAAQIDLLNCYSALDCDASETDIGSECDFALIAVGDACDATVLRRDIEEDSEIEVVEIGDHEWIDVDVDGDVEETEETEDSDDEEPEDSGPIVIPVLPDFPEIPEIPEIGPVIDFP